MEVKIEAILHRSVVNFGNETACFYKFFSGEAVLFGDALHLLRRVAGMSAPSSTYIKSKLSAERTKPTFQRSYDACCDTGRMPIHSHDSAEGLKPKRIGQAAKQFIAP